MIKRLLIVVIVALVGLMGCKESSITAWTLTGQQTDLIVGVGIEDPCGTEIGVEAQYDVSEGIEEDGWVPTLIGPYITFNLSQDISIEDTPAVSPIRDIIESLHVRPYIKLALLGSQEDYRIQPQWSAGTKFFLTPESKWPIVIAYRDGDIGNNGMYIGGMGQF